MTYRDYMKWAKEYRAEAERIEGLLEKRKKKKVFATARERSEYECGTQMMYEMRRDCLITEKLLISKANQIKEADANEKNRIRR